MSKNNIKAITLRLLKNVRHFEFVRSILALLKNHRPGIEHIAEPLAEFETAVANEDAALDQVARYDTTGQIHEEDLRRDNAFHGAREIISNGLRHFDGNKRDAAVRLDSVFEDYKTVTRQPLPDESAHIHNLLQRLEKYQDDINELGLGDWITEMQQANDNVRSLTADRESEAAARAHLKMKTIRVEIDRLYSDVLVRLEACAILEGVEVYQSLFDEINARIAEYNTILAREKGRRNSKNIAKNETGE